MCTSWILPFVFFNFAASLTLNCPHMTWEAEADEAVILPCFTEPPEDLRQTTVEWVVNNSEDVHLFLKGEDLKHQIEKYKDRTALFLDNLSSGNCSLKLDPVHLSDYGTYMCSVRTAAGKSLGTCSFNLHVTGAHGNSSPDLRLSKGEPTSPEVSINKGLKIVVGLGVGLIALVTVGALCKKYAAKKTNNLKTEQEPTEMI